MRINTQRKKLPFYDIDEIKQIPISQILSDMGINVERNNFFKIRDERTSSARIYPETNSWADFGSGKGGGVINLIMELKNIDTIKAIQLLGSRYNVQILNNAQNDNNKFVTDRQYAQIGLHGDRASKNFEFDFQNYTDEQNKRISQTLAIPMNELFLKYPQTYELMIKQNSIPYLNSIRQQYYKSIHELVNLPSNANQLDKALFKDLAIEGYNDYSKRYKILSECVKNTDININKLKPDFENDMNKIKDGKTSIEIGDYPYSEFKQLAGANHYINVSYNDYIAFERELQRMNFNITEPYSVFVKGTEATIVIKEVDKISFEGMFENIRNYLKQAQATHHIDNTKDNELEL